MKWKVRIDRADNGESAVVQTDFELREEACKVGRAYLCSHAASAFDLIADGSTVGENRETWPYARSSPSNGPPGGPHHKVRITRATNGSSVKLMVSFKDKPAADAFGRYVVDAGVATAYSVERE